MALILHSATVAGAGVAASVHRPFISLPSPPAGRRSSHVALAKKGLRPRRLDKRTVATPTVDDEVNSPDENVVSIVGGVLDSVEYSTTPMPVLPADEKDFWEGTQWDTLGFFVEYLWAFGVGFALIACLIAVLTYNEGATDFRDTTVYKESVQTKEFLEETETSDVDVFEVNPTELAPSLE